MVNRTASILVVGAVALLVAVFSVSMVQAQQPGHRVDYAVQFPQPGVASVEHEGNGVIKVQLDCIISGKHFTFEMEISFPEGESANLEVRRQGRPPDLSGWVTMTPSSLGEPDTVRVKVDVPEDAAPGTAAIVRIQDGPGGTGNGPGVKLHICAADAPPGHPTPELVRELAPSTQIGPPFMQSGLEPTPRLPTRLPEAGIGREQHVTLHYVISLLIIGSAFTGAGAIGYGFTRIRIR